MQLLQNFKELTVRPKNAQELRGLILKLAVQGKLTANWRVKNPNVEPASKLLKRIENEKKQLIADKKIKKDKSLPSINEDELIEEFPKSWMVERINNLAFLKAGGDVPKGRFSKEKTENYYVPIYANGEKNKGLYGYTDEPVITEPSITVSGRGTIGYTVLRNEPFFPIVRLIVITPFSNLTDISFLKLIIQSADFKNTGTSIPQLTVPMVKKKCIVPLPPLEEQKEIVRVVETLFKEVEQIEQLTLVRIGLKEDFVTSALNQLTTNNAKQAWAFLQDHFKSFFNETTNIKKLRETVLQLAVQGKLTADWRSCHPEQSEGSHHANQLLKRIQKEKAQLIKDKKIKKEKALPPITKDEIPYDLPEGWVWCRIRNVSYSIVPNRDKPKSFSGDITWLTTRNLKKQSNKIHAKDTDNKLTMAEVELYNARLLPSNSVIMSCVGQFGLSAILDKNYSCNQQLHCFVPLCNVEPYYLDILIKNGKEIYEDMSSATTIAYLNKTKCDSLPVSIPPLEEQKAIVQKVNALMGLCDVLEQEVQQSQKNSEQLMQSCLREVFEGEKEVII